MRIIPTLRAAIMVSPEWTCRTRTRCQTRSRRRLRLMYLHREPRGDMAVRRGDGDCGVGDLCRHGGLFLTVGAMGALGQPGIGRTFRADGRGVKGQDTVLNQLGESRRLP